MNTGRPLPPFQKLWAYLGLLVVFWGLPCGGHVALKYPPARKYDLDFLDNGRTPAPCGMPRGEIRTSLIQGTKLNVTWHLSYPHQGGYFLELLDPEEQHLMFLTPEEYFVSNDTTATYRVIKVPEFDCRNCTMRLIRLASEWGKVYRFWSCADVDILPRSEVKRTCSGRGRFFSNRCLCNKRFYGAECQYENECEEDSDCSPRFGKCIDLDATSYPKKQCFCARGYFGDKCSKVSHIRAETQVNFGVYSKRNLSESLTMYWRVLRREGELEVVLVNKGTNYAAVGWRPAGATTACRNFPDIQGPPPPKIFVGKEPKMRAEPVVTQPEVKPEPEAEPEPEPEPDSKATGKEPETVTSDNKEIEFPAGFFSPVLPGPRTPATQNAPPEAEPETTTRRAPETTTKKNGAQLSLSDRLAQFLRKKRSPEGQSSFASPLLKPARVVPITPEPKTTKEPEPKPEPKTTKEPEPESKTTKEPEPVAEEEPEPIAEEEPVPHEDQKGEPTAQAQVQPEPGATSEPEPEPASETEPKTPKAEPEPNAEGEPAPEPEPTSENEQKPKAEPEPEPEPSAESEQKTPKAEPEPNAEGEPAPEPEPKAEVEPKSEVEPEPEPQAVGSFSSYVPRGTIHPMDCTDIVVGMARGSFYRVFDYYTRDRSTPRRDEFWGGEDSLTAVFGWEKDGETTILFRKNITALHPTDYNITDSLMHVIWARGQEPNMYVHFPKSGLEKGTASDPSFYHPDELKYHGRKGQRGVTSLNFFESPNNLAQAGGGKDEDVINWCGGQWKYPHSCSRAEKNCEYFARWEFVEDTDDVYFTVASSNANLWTGIGFSNDFSMRQTDVVLGWMTPGGKYFMYDGWLRSYTPPTVDGNQGIFNMSATQEDGITTLNFARKRSSKDKQDLSFTDTECLYLVFPVKGGIVNFVNKRISKHQLTPTISTQRICIRSCAKFGGADGKPIVFTTTPRPPELMYDVEFKITNAGENMVIPDVGTKEYNTLVNQILGSTNGIFEKIPGFVVADITELDGSEPSKVKVRTRVTLNKEMHEEKHGAIDTEEAAAEANTRVFNLVEESIKTGRIGQLSVEPSFLTVNYLEAKQLHNAVTEEEVVEEAKTLSVLAFMDQNKYWFIGAGIVALICLALLQGVVTACRKKRNDPPPVSTKERLITNSRWRDYSRGATNYAYETYETEGADDPRRAPSLRTDSGSPYKNGGGRLVGGSPPNGHMNGGLPSPKEMNGGAYTDSRGASIGAYDHTRSLQRPRNVPSSVISDPRTTYSLPRGASATSSPPPYSTAMQDLTPDFYYLPSQRKYSGEVVRVYVDYNQPK